MDRNMENWLQNCILEERKSLRVGILGGSFNPIHVGHLELARYTMANVSLDGTFLMPNHLPAYKEQTNRASDADRLEMVRLAVQNERNIGWSDFEIKRGGITYTADTLKLLHDSYPEVSWYFVMGGDSVLQFDTWRSPDVILQHAALIVTTRKCKLEEDDISVSDVNAQIERIKQQHPDCNIIRIPLPELSVSSSEIRKMLAHGEVPEELLPAKTANYIRSHGLYQTLF